MMIEDLNYGQLKKISAELCGDGKGKKEELIERIEKHLDFAGLELNDVVEIEAAETPAEPESIAESKEEDKPTGREELAGWYMDKGYTVRQSYARADEEIDSQS